MVAAATGVVDLMAWVSAYMVVRAFFFLIFFLFTFLSEWHFWMIGFGFHGLDSCFERAVVCHSANERMCSAYTPALLSIWIFLGLLLSWG